MRNAQLTEGEKDQLRARFGPATKFGTHVTPSSPETPPSPSPS
jgi:hypothetical protein